MEIKNKMSEELLVDNWDGSGDILEIVEKVFSDSKKVVRNCYKDVLVSSGLRKKNKVGTLKGEFSKQNLTSKESYENIIWDLIEDRMELSEETKRDIAESEKDIREGRVYSWEEVKKELKINV